MFINVIYKITYYTLVILTIINTGLIIYFDIKNNKEEKIFKNESIIDFKITCILVWMLLFCILILCILRYKTFSIIVYLIANIGTIKSLTKSSSPSPMLTDKEDYYFLLSSAVYFVFFSNNPIINIWEFCSKSKALILIYILFNIILLIYSFITAMFLFLSEIQKTSLFKIINSKIKSFKISKVDYYFKDIDINETFFNKILYLIIFTPYIIVRNAINISKILISRYIKKNIIRLYNLIKYIILNRNKYIKLTITISIIVALIFTYIEIILNKEFFGESIKDIYELISTVILIPLLFDFVSSLTKKQSN